MTPPLVIVHWAECLTSAGAMKIRCIEETGAIGMLTADGQSGLDSEMRRFDLDLSRVTCADCKALIAEALGVRP